MSVIANPPPLHLIKIVTDQWTAPYWEAAARRQLVVPRCMDCGRFRMPPTPFCPDCRSQGIDWVAIEGNGTLYSYTIVEKAIVPGTESAIPYVPAIITLPEADHVRLISNIVDTPLAAIATGRDVRLCWQDLDDGLALPTFRVVMQE